MLNWGRSSDRLLASRQSVTRTLECAEHSWGLGWGIMEQSRSLASWAGRRQPLIEHAGSPGPNPSCSEALGAKLFEADHSHPWSLSHLQGQSHALASVLGPPSNITATA